MLTIGPKISEIIDPIIVEAPVLIILDMLEKKDLMACFISSKKVWKDLALLFRKRTKPFMISFANEKSADTAIIFNASFPAFNPISLAVPFAISLLIAFLASLSAFFISSSSASSLSCNCLLFLSFKACFSALEKLDLSIF